MSALSWDHVTTRLQFRALWTANIIRLLLLRTYDDNYFIINSLIFDAQPAEFSLMVKGRSAECRSSANWQCIFQKETSWVPTSCGRVNGIADWQGTEVFRTVTPLFLWGSIMQCCCHHTRGGMRDELHQFSLSTAATAAAIVSHSTAVVLVYNRGGSRNLL